MMLPKSLMLLGAATTGIGVLVITKNYFGGPVYLGKERLAGKTVIITGATTGIGKESAAQLAEKAPRLLLACRDLQKCEEVKRELIECTHNTNIHCRHLDLTSLKSVRKFAEDVNANEKRLDILVNNAGVMGLKHRTLTEDGFETMLAVNHLAPFHLTNLLLDKLHASGDGRIIYLTNSSIRNKTVSFDNLNCTEKYDPYKSYLISKLISRHCGKVLWHHIEDTQKNIRIFFVHPGICNTELSRHISTSRIAKFTRGLIMRTPTEGAYTVTYCALADFDPLSQHIYHDLQEVDYASTIGDDIVSQRLWAVSEHWCQQRLQLS